MKKWYYVKTEQFCGSVVVDQDGVVCDAAPIFVKRFKLVGRKISEFPAHWVVSNLTEVEDDFVD